MSSSGLERLDAAKQLSLLNSLREELKGEQARAQDMGLDGRGFAIYGLLERQRPMAEGGDSTSYNAANRDLASLIDEAVIPFTELVDWWQKDDLQRQIALVHNSRSRSTIVLYSRIRGSP